MRWLFSDEHSHYISFDRLLGSRDRGDQTTYPLAWQDHGPYWVSALVSIGFINFPFFVLPYFADLNDIGAFALAFKLLNICTTILLILSAIFSPRFSQLTKEGDLAAAKALLLLTRRLSLFAFLPIGFRPIGVLPFIHPVFGDGFADGWWFLLILTAGQLCNAATGLSGQLLNMAGEGAVEMKLQLFGMVLALALTPFAGAYAGAIGIATVYSVCVALRSFGSLYFANQILSARHPLAA